ncbi:MAG: hypothetical protein ACM3U2_12990 [Deltaproteobacteria bacterium]
MSGKRVLEILALLGCVGTVYTVSLRLSTDALNVLLGVLCGIGVSIPVMLGLGIALTRQRSDIPIRERPEEVEERPAYVPAAYRQPYPPVIFVAPSQQGSGLPFGTLLPPGAYPRGYNLQEPPASRDFRIIGDDDSWDA